MDTSPFDIRRAGNRPTEQDMLESLGQGLAYPPAALRALPAPPDALKARADALVEVTCNNRTGRFAVEVKASSTPRVVEQAAWQAKAASAGSTRPMVMAPYLSEKALLRLRESEVSGIDLSGNCVILGSSFTVWRSGAPNRCPESRPIMNPFSGDSSIIARSFLLRPEYETLGALREFALSRLMLSQGPDAASLTPGTASKVVRTLEEELICARRDGAIRLSNPRELLDRLRKDYKAPAGPRLSGRTPLEPEQVWRSLAEAAGPGGLRCAATGTASAGRYGVLSSTEPLALYVSSLSAAASLLQVTETRAFPNITLVEARKNLFYFDTRPRGDAVWASPIQTWLELAQAGPREQEGARALEQPIVEGRAAEL